MRKILLTLSVFLLLPVFAHAEYIESFKADIDVRKDSSFTVTETIDYRFSEERHGIFRKIPLTHPEEPSAFFKERIIDIELTEVTLDENPVQYVLESTDDFFVVKIGDPNTTLTGPHIYTISYVVRGGLSYPKGEGAELYWNVTGTEWPVPIRIAEATLGSSDEVFRSIRSCYRGTFGSTSGSCLTTQTEDGRVSFRTMELMVGEGMTVAQSIDITRITKDVRERTNFYWFFIPLFIVGVLYSGFRIYRYNTANRTGAPIIPQYEPYPDAKPMYSGLLMDGRLDPHDLTACIVYLAEQGYLKIKKTEKKVMFLFEVDDYEITLKRIPGENVGAFEKRVLELLFDAPLTSETTITLSTLKHDRAEQVKNHAALESLKQDLRKDLVSSGFFEQFKLQRIFTLLGIILAVSLIVSILTTGTLNVFIIFVMLFAGILSIVFLHRRRTLKGYEALDHLKGFKLFLEMTDRDRFAFHNAPAKSPEQFMEYLPYAIAFGVEKEWAKVFEGFTIPQPDWYDGGSVGSFSPTGLSSSLGAFSNAFVASSGASASSGGGSSGGGAGGGGGGSW